MSIPTPIFAPSAQEALPLTTGMPSGNAIKFYRRLQRLSRGKDPETGKPRGYTFTFCRTLAKWSEVTVRTIHNWLAELRACGWIETQTVIGRRVFIRPLLRRVPSEETSTPRPEHPFVQPEIERVIERVAAPEDAQNAPSLSGVVSQVVAEAPRYGASSGVSSTSRYHREQQHRRVPGGSSGPDTGAVATETEKERKKRTDLRGFPRRRQYTLDEAEVLAALGEAGVESSAFPALLQLGIETLRDALSITFWRGSCGKKIDGGGYVRHQAEQMALKKYERPKRWERWLSERGVTPGTAQAVTVAQTALRETWEGGSASASGSGGGPGGPHRPLPLGSPVSDRRANGEQQRPPRYEQHYDEAKRAMVVTGPHPEDRALIERLAKSATGWRPGQGDEKWKARANKLWESREYLWYPLDWQPESKR